MVGRNPKPDKIRRMENISKYPRQALVLVPWRGEGVEGMKAHCMVVREHTGYGVMEIAKYLKSTGTPTLDGAAGIPQKSTKNVRK